MTAPAPDVASKRLLPWLVAVAFFMEQLDVTILNTAVPTVAQALKVPPLDLKAALTSYSLSLAVGIPVSGWIADRFGTRRVFAAAIGIFTLGSVFCGLAWNVPTLVAARVIQGIGGAMMVPVGRITLVRTFAKSEMVRTMTYVTIPALIGPLLGPVLGGFIVTVAPWQTIFFINVPIGLAGLYLVFKHLPDYRGERRSRLDLRGFLLFGGGVALLSYVLEVFGEHRWPLSVVGLMFAGAVLLLLSYGWHYRRVAEPLLDLGLYRIRTFRAAVAGGFVTRLGVGGMPFLLPLFYQIALGYSPAQAGGLIFPQALAAMTLKLVAPRILSRFGYRAVLVANTTAMGVLMSAFALLTPTTPVALILGLAFVYGFFSSLQFTSMNTLVFADIGPSQTSMASGLSTTSQNLSLSFGIAVASFTVAAFLGGRREAPPEEMIAAIRGAFLVLGGLTLLSTLLFRTLRPNDAAAVSGKRSFDEGRPPVGSSG